MKIIQVLTFLLTALDLFYFWFGNDQQPNENEFRFENVFESETDFFVFWAKHRKKSIIVWIPDMILSYVK